MAGTPAGEGVAGLRRVFLHDSDDAADLVFDRCRRHTGLNAVLIGNVVLDSRDNLFPDSRQGDVSRGHLELVAGLIDSAADVGLPALEGLAVYCGRSCLDGDPGADLGLDCACSAVANGVNIGQVSLCSRDNLFPDSRQGDVGGGHGELVVGLHDFVADCDVASPALEDVLRGINIRRRACDDDFAEDIDIRSVRGIALFADVGQALRHVLPLRVERDLFAVFDGLIREVSLVGIGIAGAVSRGVPAVEDIELYAVLFVGAHERVLSQHRLNVIGEDLTFHRAGIVIRVGIENNTVFDGSPLCLIGHGARDSVGDRRGRVAAYLCPALEVVARAGRILCGNRGSRAVQNILVFRKDLVAVHERDGVIGLDIDIDIVLQLAGVAELELVEGDRAAVLLDLDGSLGRAVGYVKGVPDVIFRPALQLGIRDGRAVVAGDGAGHLVSAVVQDRFAVEEQLAGDLVGREGVLAVDFFLTGMQ